MNLKEFKNSGRTVEPHFLLIGNPVGHSLSPLMHNTAAEYYNMPVRYHAVQLEAAELSSFAAYLNQPRLKGVNITIPYKEQILPFVDALTETAREVGAINTILKVNGKLIGDNTDIYGFRGPLESIKEDFFESKALIFGTGGASKAIIFALQQLGFEEVIMVSRNPEQRSFSYSGIDVQVCSYDAWPAYADDLSLVVNATPLGMAPHMDTSPVGEHEMQYLSGTICYDIVYRPQQTRFLNLAEKSGARTIGGLEMLIYQGSRSFEQWTGKAFPIEIIRDTLNDYLNNGD